MTPEQIVSRFNALTHNEKQATLDAITIVNIAGRSPMAASIELTAAYVRDYLASVLEFCPTDHFVLAPDSSWCIDPRRFKDLPHAVKRLVERIDMKFVRGSLVYSVEFVSKKAALALAAKFTLVQKVDAAVTVVPWDEIGGALSGGVPDTVEQRLNGNNGP